MTVEEFKKIQWENKPQPNGFYISKDKKYISLRLGKDDKPTLHFISDKLLNELKEKQIIPEWLYIYRDENCVVSENYPNAIFKKEFSIADVQKIIRKIRTLWEVSVSNEKDFNFLWVASDHFRWKSKYYYTDENKNGDDLSRYINRFAYIKAERILRQIITKNEWVVAHNNLSQNTIVFIDDEPFFVAIHNLDLSMPLWDICAFKNNSNYNVRLSDNLDENEIRFYHAFLKWLELNAYTPEQIIEMPNYHVEKIRFQKIWEEFMLIYKKLDINEVDTYIVADRNEIIEYFTEATKEDLKLQSPFAYNELKIFHYHWIEMIFMRKVLQLWALMRDHSGLKAKKNGQFLELQKYFLKNETKLKDFMNSKDINILKSEKFQEFYKIYRDGSIKALRTWASPKEYLVKSFEMIRLVSSPKEINNLIDFILFNDYSYSLEDRYALTQKLQKVQ